LAAGGDFALLPAAAGVFGFAGEVLPGACALLCGPAG